MNSEEFHKPFIKALITVAIVTVFAMVSSRFIVKYYMNYSISSQKTIEYSSQQSQEQVYSAGIK